jgi:hypothetical protein
VWKPPGHATVNVPPAPRAAARLRLKGRGLPNRRGDPGDFYAEAQIRVPASLSPEERKLFRGATRALQPSTRGACDDHRARYALARPFRLSLDSYARLTGVHPDLVRRLTALGLLEMTRDTSGDPWFEPSQVSAMARIHGCTEN